jgi:hypothetical protein
MLIGLNIFDVYMLGNSEFVLHDNSLLTHIWCSLKKEKKKNSVLILKAFLTSLLGNKTILAYSLMVEYEVLFIPAYLLLKKKKKTAKPALKLFYFLLQAA